MNERIKELYEQSLIRETGKDHAGNPMLVIKQNPKKFAELIVRECLLQCEKIAVDANAMTKSKFVTDAGCMLHEGMWGGAKNCSGQIREYFGVEE